MNIKEKSLYVGLGMRFFFLVSKLQNISSTRSKDYREKRMSDSGKDLQILVDGVPLRGDLVTQKVYHIFAQKRFFFFFLVPVNEKVFLSKTEILQMVPLMVIRNVDPINFIV